MSTAIREGVDEAVASIEHASDAFEDAVLRQDISLAGAAAQRQSALIAEVRKRLTALRDEAGSDKPEARDPDAADEAAWSLIRQRAYVLGAKEIRLEARDALSEMTGWHLPRSRLRNLEGYVRQAEGDDLEAARAALFRIFDEYDYWDSYTDEFNQNTLKLSAMLGVAALVLLAGAVTAACYSWTVAAVFVAGASGACVSVLSRPPRISTYGSTAGSWQAMGYRLVAGTLASAIGLGFVLLGILPISVPDAGKSMSLSVLASACLTVDRSFSPQAERAGAERPAEPAPCTEEPCGVPAKVVLLSIALLLGFSERMLPRFEEMIAGGNSTPPKRSDDTAPGERRSGPLEPES